MWICGVDKLLKNKIPPQGNNVNIWPKKKCISSTNKIISSIKNSKTQMKIKLHILSLFIVVCSFSAVGQKPEFHQHNLPQMLNVYPGSFSIPSVKITELLNGNAQSSFKILLGNSMWLDLVYINKQTWEDGSETIAYSVSNLPEGTILNINKVFRQGAVSYRAHIVNHKYSDSYQLSSFNEREFEFKKTDTENIVAE